MSVTDAVKIFVVDEIILPNNLDHRGSMLFDELEFGLSVFGSYLRQNSACLSCR